MSRKKLLAAVLVGFLVLLGGTALAFSELFFTFGTVSSYDFGGYGPGYDVPGTVVVEGFTISPGESVGWHYHKGTSYVVIARGKISEEEVRSSGNCVTTEDTAGQAFVESPGRIHNVTNNGTQVAAIWWATIFPQSDGVQSDGTYYVDPPNCD